MQLLIKFTGNWADEFDVDGFQVMEAQKWLDHLEEVQEKVQFPYEHYFGTNEFIEFESFEEYRSYFHVTNISDGDAEFLKEKFDVGKYGYGHFMSIDVEEACS